MIIQQIRDISFYFIQILENLVTSDYF